MSLRSKCRSMKFRRWINVLKEPIVQFIALGALLFALDHLLLLNRDDPRNVLIGDEQISEFIEIFEDGQGRSPSGREINNMVIAWAQNEILYREARRMGLDRGDDMIRNRLLLKIRHVMFNNVVLEQPIEEQLQQFFERNQAAYRIPERYDLELIVLPVDVDLADGEELQERIQRAGPPDTWPGTRYRYQNRDEESLVALFGIEGSAKLLSVAPDNERWSLIPTAQGHHLVRVTAVREATAPSLESIRSRVVQDWERYAGDKQLADQTYSIARKYQVRLDLSDAYLEKMADELPKNLLEKRPGLSSQSLDDRAVLSEFGFDG